MVPQTLDFRDRPSSLFRAVRGKNGVSNGFLSVQSKRMKLVVDCGALRSANLSEFLSNSRHNRAILTSASAIESYKGDGLINARESLKILSRFPGQVWVLKPTAEIALISTRPDRIISRIVDWKKSRGFSNYCDQVLCDSSESVDKLLSYRSRMANDHCAWMHSQVEHFRAAAEMAKKAISKDTLKRLRAQKPLTHDQALEIISLIAMASGNVLGVKPIGRDEDFKSMVSTYHFRFISSYMVLILNWLGNGGLENTPDKKIVNDLTDATYVAFGTMFDGILSNDIKLNSVYLNTRPLVEYCVRLYSAS